MSAFTNIWPVLKKIVFLASLCLSVFTTSSQVPDSLIDPLRTYYQDKTSAEISAYSYKEKGKWLKYLPTVGMGFSLESSGSQGSGLDVPMPIVSFNSRTIYQIKNDKQTRKAKIESIIAQNELLFNEDIRKLRRLLQELKRKEIELSGLKSEWAIRYDLYRIDSTNYYAQELKPSGYLRSQLSWAEFNQGITLKKLSIERILDEIHETARVGEPYDLGFAYSDRNLK